jgi:predicted double-glycine peptidase
LNDVYIAIAIMGAASVGAFVLATVLATRLKPKTVAALAVLACAFIVSFALVLHDNLLLARLLPFSAVIILGNWLPPGVCFLAGVAWRRMSGPAARKAVLLLPLMLLCAYQSHGWLPADPPPLDDRWKEGVCRQTSSASCSAAAAATLLRAHGIDAGEAEMARLCLTRPSGTSMLGLYRGLKLKCTDAGWEVQPFRADVDGLRRESGPVILSVRLDAGPEIDPRYARDWGWAPGVAHTVVLFGFDADGKPQIGDPAVGRERWSARDLRALWHGDAIRLVRR